MLDEDAEHRRETAAHTQRALRVMTVFLERGAGDALWEELCQIDEEDKSLVPLVVGLINLTQRVLYTLADGTGLSQKEALARFAWFEAAHGEGVVDLGPGTDR